jgi:hypothetical protein
MTDIPALIERLETIPLKVTYDYPEIDKAIAALRAQQAEIERLRFALDGLYQDQLDYIRLNHLPGAENNHWMVIARAALAGAGTT